MTSPSRRVRRTRTTSIVAAAGLAAALVAAAPSSATPSVRPVASPDAVARAQAVASGGAAHTITLITGDVVRVTDVGNGRSTTEITRAHGAVGGVRAQTIGTHTYVLPDEVLPYLAAGTVDRRLFDVTSLIEQGYDDEHSSGIPLIVSYTSASAAAQVVPAGATKLRTLPSVQGAALRATKRTARGVWDRLAAPGSGRTTSAPRTSTMNVDPAARVPALGTGIARIWLDGRVHTTLADSTAQIGSAQAWAAGYDGHGVKVAILDTGVDLNHPDFAGRISATESFVPGETVQDANSHGTHTASTVGGSGAASGGLEKGVAPGADLMIGKVLADQGYGEDSWVIAGMEWAATHGAKVISMSLSGSDPSNGTEPMCQATDALSAAHDVLFVVAAGNTGSEGAISCPSAANSALTVGAVDSTDTLADFSSRGPRWGDYGLKPDISAPGVDILAARADGNADIGWYQAMSGTSMATPHVAGAAAILMQEHPAWSAQDVKNSLMSTSLELPAYTAYQVGAGRVDLTRAIASTVTATGSTYFGYAAWPHTAPVTESRVITYSNDADSAVTLELAEQVQVTGGPFDVDPTADAGTPAPDGMFALSASSVTVPAHGTATVTALANPAQAMSGRRYLGQVTATTGGAVVARTQIGLYAEDERYTLTIKLTDRSGNPASSNIELQRFGFADPTVEHVGESGVLTLRLPRDTYSLQTYLDALGTKGRDSRGVVLLSDPEIVLDHDVTVDLDARRAVEVAAVVAGTTENRVQYLNWYRADGEGSAIAEQYMLPEWCDTMYALPTEAVTQGAFEFEARWRKSAPPLTVTDRGTPVRMFGQAGSPSVSGSSRLATVYAGLGSVEELDAVDARGKAVIVRRSSTVDASTRVANAAQAGAALVVTVNDVDEPGIEYVGQFDGSQSAVPAVLVTASTGDALVARALSGRGRLAVRGIPNSPFVYDLVDPHPGRIPTNLTYRPRAKDLATVDMVFHGSTPYASGEFRWDYRPYRQMGFGFMLRIDMPGTRVDHVSTQPGVEWAEAAATGPQFEWVSSSLVHALEPGSRTTDHWFGAVVRPRNGGGFWSSTRYSDFIAFNVQPWADGGAPKAGYLQYDDTKHLKVYQEGVLVAESDWASTYVSPITNDQTHFTLDLVADRDPSVYALSPHTHTVWEVNAPPISNGPDTLDLVSLLQLDYDVDTDLAGRARGGRQTLGVRASHLEGAVGAGRIGRVTLAVSFDDGRHWRPVRLERDRSGAQVAHFTAPRSGFVSLRATARDDAGNAITQDVIHAYGLR